MATLCTPFGQRKLKDQCIPISHVYSKPLSQGGFFVLLLACCNSLSVWDNKEIPWHTGSVSTFFPLDTLDPFFGGPWSWRDTPPPPVAPPCCSVQTSLFSVSLVFHIPVFVQLCCPLWNLVHCGLCGNVLQRTVLDSNYACVQPPPISIHAHTHTHTHTYSDVRDSMVGLWSVYI